MDILKLFFKSKEDTERDRGELRSSSYPYGPQQEEKIHALLKELLPEEPENLSQTIFLLLKQAYLKDLAQAEDETLPLNEGLPGTFRTLNRQLFGRHRGKQPRYLALVMADSLVDEDLSYPDVDTLGRKAEELSKYCKKKKTRSKR